MKKDCFNRKIIYLRELFVFLFFLSASSSTLANSTRLVDFDFGGQHGCALFDNQIIKCWGYNNFGQLGLGDAVTRGDESLEMGGNLPAVFLGSDFKAVSVMTGGSHTCARSSENRIKCWGANTFGQLGGKDTSVIGDEETETGDFIPYLDFTEETQTDGELMKFVAGQNHNCVLFASGRVKCFGYNGNGELGIEMKSNGVLKHQSTFVKFPGKISDVFVSFGKTCIVDEFNKLYCFGGNHSGSAGQEISGPIGNKDGDIANLKPIKLGTDAKIIDVSGQSNHTCVSFENERPRCFGLGYKGILGTGNAEPVGEKPGEMGEDLLPVQFPNISALRVSGGFLFNCGLDNEMGKVYCWGEGTHGQLGSGYQSNIGEKPEDIESNLSPVDLGQEEFVVKIKTASDSTCALLKGHNDFKEHKLKCWGVNNHGQLGQGHRFKLGDDSREMGKYLKSIEF